MVRQLLARDVSSDVSCCSNRLEKKCATANKLLECKPYCTYDQSSTYNSRRCAKNTSTCYKIHVHESQPTRPNTYLCKNRFWLMRRCWEAQLLQSPSNQYLCPRPQRTNESSGMGLIDDGREQKEGQRRGGWEVGVGGGQIAGP